MAATLALAEPDKFAKCNIWANKDNLFKMFQNDNRGRCTAVKIYVLAIAYALFCMILFGSIYAGIGYSTLFETTEENRNCNMENSIIASMMLQSNAMGSVVPINSAGRWLSAIQTCSGWVWMLVCIAWVTTL
jgi:hypothetical protein